MKVLVAEDDIASQHYFRDTIEAQGYEVKIAPDGREALKLFHQFQPDLVLTDIQMPVMDGLELLENIRQSGSSAIVVMVTAYGSEKHAVRALHLGANNYLKKPVRHEELLPLLKKYDDILQHQTLQKQIVGMIERRNLVIKFDNLINRIPEMVDFLILEAGHMLSHNDTIAVRLGLYELLTNAVEHGNLGISFKEKIDAMDKGTWQEFCLQREQAPHLSKRKVTVECDFSEQKCQWLIRDDGEGFDFKALPDLPDDLPDGDSAPCGRGIFISRHQFEELEFIEAGNMVRVVKIPSF